jgi:hypothetical protein
MEESNEIKNAVSKRSIFDPMGGAPLPPMIQDIEKKIMENPETAPLFIKIDKYKDILQNLHDLKRSISNISNILSVRDDLEKLRGKSNEVLEKSFNQFIDLANILNEHFAAPNIMKPFIKTENIERMDDFVVEMQREIEKMKKGMESFI